MYTTIIHPLRKALQLSCNEYIVLDLISRLSHNVKYNGWCIASKANIAKMTDLSERKIFTTIDKLVSLELIEKDDTTKHIRTTDKFNKLMAKHDNFYLGYKDKEESFFSGKPLYAESADTMQKVQTGYAESADQPMQKVHTTIITNNKINTTNPVGLETIPSLPESITTTLKDRGVEFDITPASWKGFREDYPADKLEETVINAIHWIADKYEEKHKGVKDKVLRTGRLRTFLKDVPKIPKRLPYEPWVAYKIRCNPNATEYEKQIYDELVKDEKKRLNLQAND